MIDVQNLKKSYGNVQVLKGMNLHIPKEKITVILGRSGVGKSVLLRHISGLEEPDSGEIAIHGVPLFASIPSKREELLSDIGMLFQNAALFDSLTIAENVSFSLEHNPLLRQKIHPTNLSGIVDEALEKVGLQGFQPLYPSELSGGQKRRAALARLMVYEPNIILFDEPTAGLDPITAMQIYLLLAETQKRLHATCVVVTHDITAALAIGDFFAFHHDGIIAATGDKRTFFQDPHPVLRHLLRCSAIPSEWWPILHQKEVYLHS